MNIAADLISTLRSRGEQVAIVDADGSVTTYSELCNEVERGSARIAAADLDPRSSVVVQAPKGVAFTSATIALAADGHRVVGIEMAQGDAVYLDRARYVRADAVLATKKVRALQRSAALRRQLARYGIDVPPPLDLPTIDWDSDIGPQVEANGIGHLADVDDEDVVFVVFTGGTTSQPKGVQLSHRSVRSYLAGLDQLPDWPGVTSVVADHPQQVLYGLAHGKTVYLSPARTEARPKHTADLLFGQGVDCYFGSPTMWHDILATGVHRTATTWPNAVLLGGAPVTQRTLETLERELDPSVAVRCLYGMTEAGLIAHISGADKLALLRSGVDGDPVGQLVDGVEARLGDDQEILIRSGARFSGYVGQPTDKPNAFFPTGDVGTVDDRGVRLLGRKKNMILQAGVNLYPEQFEAKLLARRSKGRALFDDVALIPGRANSIGNEHFVLCYVSPTADEPRALASCRGVFPRGHAPTEAVRFDELPRSGRQAKLDRRALAMRIESENLDVLQSDIFDRLVAAVPPRSIDRRRVLAIRTLARDNLKRAQAISSTVDPITDPIFVLGHQRSGTTLLHRALASCPGATAMTLTDMLAPHPLGWRLSQPVAKAGKALHGVSKRSARWASLYARHDLDPTAPEEEEWLFAALGLSGFLPSAFAATVARSDFDDLRDRSRWDPCDRRALLDLYAKVISEWHGRHGSDGAGPLRHVAKNPAFGPMAQDLLHAFPDARFIVAVREPHAAIASRLALFAEIHKRPLTAHGTHVVVNDSLRQLNGLAQQLGGVPKDRVQLVAFDELMAEPDRVLHGAAEFAGLKRGWSMPTIRPIDRSTSAIIGYSPEEIAAAVPDFIELCADNMWKDAA